MPNWQMGAGYSDGRRNSGSRCEASTYRPGERERPQAPRRDSRDPRDFRDSRDPRDPRDPRDSIDAQSPREPRREHELPPKPLNVETSFRPPEGPRKMSNIPPLGNDLQFKRMNTALEKPIATNSAIGDAPMLAIPKAKNPELQETFEIAYKWGEKCNERLLLSIRKNKTAQERAQRDFEKEKYKAKAAAYPPFHGLGEKSNPADQNLDDQVKAAEDEYLHELEQIVARFTTNTNPVVDSHQDPVITELVAKVEQISKLAADQSEQIQRLLEKNGKSDNSVTSLETDVVSMKSSHNDLEAKYSALKSDHETLQSKFRSYDDTIHALESKQAIIDAENQRLKKQLSGFQSGVDKKLGAFGTQLTAMAKTSDLVDSKNAFDTQLTEMAKKTSDLVDSKNAFEAGLEKRISGIEAKLHDYNEAKDKLDELDMATWNEICDAWVSSVHNLKAQHEEYKERRGQDKSSMMDDALRSLRQEVDSLRSGQSDVSQPDRGLTLSIQEVEEVVNARVAAAEQTINNNSRAYSEKKDDLFSELIIGLEARLDTFEQGAAEHSQLQTRVQTLEQRNLEARLDTVERGVADSQFETRIQSLEQWKLANSAWMDEVRTSDLSERVARLEGQRVGHRVDRIDLSVGDLSRKYEGLKDEISPLAKREWVELRVQELLTSVSMNAGLISDVQALVERRVPALEHAIRTLDAQYQNLSTKHLAELIIKLTNPVVEQRLGRLEAKAHQLETKTSSHDEQLSIVLGLMRPEAVPGEKRNASPNHFNNPNKRQKLETNGQHPSPLQQPQRNNSVQHAS